MAVNLDDRIFPNPNTFDPMRFYKIREKHRAQGDVEAAKSNQFLSSSMTHLSWGFGKHTCPGRGLAAQEIKMIIAQIILRYDFKIAEGSSERYRNIASGHLVSWAADYTHLNQSAG